MTKRWYVEMTQKSSVYVEAETRDDAVGKARMATAMRYAGVRYEAVEAVDAYEISERGPVQAAAEGCG